MSSPRRSITGQGGTHKTVPSRFQRRVELGNVIVDVPFFCSLFLPVLVVLFQRIRGTGRGRTTCIEECTSFWSPRLQQAGTTPAASAFSHFFFSQSVSWRRKVTVALSTSRGRRALAPVASPLWGGILLQLRSRTSAVEKCSCQCHSDAEHLIPPGNTLAGIATAFSHGERLMVFQ